MNTPTTRLGILDWGIGGVGFLKLARARWPQLDILYWADSGTTPYGKQPLPKLGRRLQNVAAKMVSAHHVTHLVIACNAASSALPHIQMPIPTLGVIEQGIAEILKHKRSSLVGVIGGQRTIDSAIHRDALEAVGMTVLARTAQPLSAHVEAGRLTGPLLERDLLQILTPLRDVDILLLACTHYPAIQHEISRCVPHALLIDPVTSLLGTIETSWELQTAGGSGVLMSFTSGDPLATQHAALLAFGVDLGNVSLSQI